MNPKPTKFQLLVEAIQQEKEKVEAKMSKDSKREESVKAWLLGQQDALNRLLHVSISIETLPYEKVED